MKARAWISTHRTAVFWGVTPLLTIFLPIPGLFVAALFWPEGVHSFESTRDGILFLAVMFGVSGIAWGAFVNGVLPRGTPMRGESANPREVKRDRCGSCG